MRTPVLLLALLTLACVPALLAEDIPLIDSSEPAKGWKSNNGPEFPGAKVALEADPAVLKDGKPSLRLTADLSGGGNYCDMSRDVAAMKLEIESVSFWLKAPGMNGLGMRLIDGNGRCHQISLKLDPVSDDWRLVTFPIARFFAKRGTAEAVQGVARYESWGGKKGAPDGWSGQLKAFILLAGRQKQSSTIWVADLVASVRAGTTGWSCGFEEAAALPIGWKSVGKTAIVTANAFKGSNALQLARSQDTREQPVSVSSATFPIAPGVWEISAALAVDLESPDASYCGSLHFEAIDSAGKVIETTEIATPYGTKPWQAVRKQVRTSYQTAAGRLVARINKTIGSFRIDELAAKPLDTAKLIPAVDRIVLASPAKGNLLLPEEARTYSISVESTRALQDAERSVTWTVCDYWGAEQTAPATVTVEADGRNKNRFRYTATVDLAAAPLETGRYYEFHAVVPLSDNEPFRNSSGFAILPVAASKAFAPAQIPFTARNWDNRIGDYITLADRLGFRIIGLWGGADDKPPYKAHAPGIEQCAKLGAAILTGCPANLNAIEYRRPGWEKWTDETTIRGAIRSWFAAYGEHQPKPIVVNLGNEPHGTGEQVLQQVAAYKIAYDEIKKVAPDCIVVATSVEPNEEYFKAGYGEACDAFDFHVYETPDSVRHAIRAYQALMQKYNCVKPIWSTEIGLNSQGLTRQHISADMVKKFAAFFASGGANMNWFDLLYPDGDGKALGTSGDSFNMFDSRYNAYAARLDAVSCYNLINGILDKRFVAERTWTDGTYACLFRDAAGACFAMIWRDAGRADIQLPLPGVQTVTAIRIDGRRTTLQAGGQGIGLSVSPDPILLAYNGPDSLPAALGAPALRIATAPDRLMRGTPGVIELAGTADPQLVSLVAPPGWTVERAKNAPLRFTIASPAASLARNGDILVRVTGADGAIQSELSVRPVLTGQLAVDIIATPGAAGGKPTVQVVVSNQSLQPQTVTWALLLPTERSLIDGNYAAPVKTTAYLGEAGNGSLTVAPKSQATVSIPVVGTEAGKLYQLSASITDATGGVISTDADLKR
jgi:hypothetical protein